MTTTSEGRVEKGPYHYHATVAISGPGGTFAGEVQAIVSTLRLFGVDVDIEDRLDESESRGVLSEDLLAGRRVLVRVDHIPWGG